MKQYIEAAESNHLIKSAIMKIIVHKIEIKPNGLEIFFNVGENHYKEALGKTPSASFFVSTDYKNKKPSADFSTEGPENLKIFGSSCLTIGGGGTPTPNPSKLHA